MKERKLLFSITKDDFEIQTFRSGGKGGQHQNKVESGVRIIHRATGLSAESRNYRTQLANRKAAFRRLIETPELQKWLKIKTASVLAGIHDIECEVDKAMRPENLKIEYL